MRNNALEIRGKMSNSVKFCQSCGEEKGNATFPLGLALFRELGDAKIIIRK